MIYYLFCEKYYNYASDFTYNYTIQQYYESICCTKPLNSWNLQTSQPQVKLFAIQGAVRSLQLAMVQ